MPDFSDLSKLAGAQDPRSASTKAAIRTARFAARRALPTVVRAEADAALRTALAALVRARQPSVVAGYIPLPDEPGGPELPDALGSVPPSSGPRSASRPGRRLLLPVLRPDSDLDWAAYTGPAELITSVLDGAAGRGRVLREPAGARLGRDAIGQADLVVVPAVAVDLRGVRLGRGGGSYDRALTRVAPQALVVAMLYDDDLVDVLPTEAHDRPVDAVLTPSGGFLHRTE